MPDERAIMTYVSSYYHCFAGKIKVNLALHSTDRKIQALDIFPKLFFFFRYYFEIENSIESSRWTVRGSVPDDTIECMGYCFCWLPC